MRYEEARHHPPTDQHEDSLHPPALGKQTLSQDVAPSGGGSQQGSSGDSAESTPRRADGDADQSFLAALGLPSTDADGTQASGGGELWGEGEEQEPAEAEALGSESGGSESGGGDDDSSEAAAEEPAGGGPAARPAGSEAPGEAGGQLAGFDPFFTAAPMPEGEGPSAPPPPAAGTTIDVAPPPTTAGSDDQIEATARAGVASAAAPVPHAEKLQRAFGPDHDLTQLRAQIGGGQAQATELGAFHFAFGSSLYFSHQPTEGEAAHEVAHALLQQQGERPATGHQQDPAAEKHAELIAKRVEAEEPVGDLLPKRSGSAVAKVQRQATPGQEFLQSSWALVNVPGILYDNTGARLRNAPSESSSYVTLPQNTKVQILTHNPQARWYAVVTAEGKHGYIADWLVWRHLPEGNANVHLVKKGETPLTIARDHYGPHFGRWGQDLRFVVNALVYVNNKGPRNGTGGPGLAKPGSVTESWLKATAAENVHIWLPSANYLNSVYEEVRKHGGGTGSTSFDTFSRVAGKVGAFSVLPAYVGGLAHGFLQSLGDTVSSIFDLLKSIFTGAIIEDVKKLWAALSKLSIKDVVDALGSWAQSWAPRLTSEDHFVRGHAWGYFAGYLCAELAMFALGGAALNAIKASKLGTKLGQIVASVAPKLTAAVGKITSAGRASTKALGEAKDAVLKRFGQAKAVVGPLQEVTSTAGKVIGRFQRGSHLEIISKGKKLYGGNRIALDPNKTTTLTGVLNDVNVVATRGQQLTGVTLMGPNKGGINILRSPRWVEIQTKYKALLDAGRELDYWKKVTDEFWEVANRPWLDQAIARGDQFRFVSSPTDELALYVTKGNGEFVLDGGNRIRSIFGREIDYLKSKGYLFHPDGTATKIR